MRCGSMMPDGLLPWLQPAVLEEMPPYAEKESGILTRLDKMREVADDTGKSRKRVAKTLEKVTAAAVAAAPAAAAAAAPGEKERGCRKPRG